MPPSRRRLHEEVVISDIRELRDVSRTQFLKFLSKLQANPQLLNTPPTRYNWDKSLFIRFDSVVVSDTYELKEAGTFVLESCDPGELVQLILSSGPQLAKVYMKAHSLRPCTRENPWHIIIGFDEFLPGNPTAGQHSKKTMCLYFNFTELGSATLVEAASWMCPLILPTEVESDIPGGWSRVFADFLERCFFGRTGFLTAGVPICYGSDMFVLYADLGIIISDGDGLRKAFAWKGASSIRPCFKHDNCLKKGSGLGERMDGFYEITHAVAADFHLRSHSDLFDAADKVAAAYRRLLSGAISNARYQLISKAEGLNYHAQALPWRMRLRTTIDWLASFTYDWVHTMLQDGPMNIDMFLYLQTCQDFLSFAQVEEWLLLDWKFPAAYASKGHALWRIFCQWRKNGEGEHDKVKCSASELLGCYALVRLLFEVRVPAAPERAAAKESFLLCCKLVDIFQRAKKKSISMSTAADMLDETVPAYINKHKEAYGDDNVRPKFHWLFDIIEQMRVQTMLHDQFIIERLHLWIKRPAEKIDNTRRWERSVLAEALNHQTQDLQLMKGPCHVLDNSVMQAAEYPDAVFCKNIRVMGKQLSVGDVIFLHDCAGKILMCGQEDDLFFVIVELWDAFEVWTDNASTWRATTRRREVADALEVEMVCAWRMLPRGEFIVVRH